MLELSGLVKRFGETVALNGLELRSDVGEIVGIAGPNGAGKSTLIHVLAGEIEEDEGDVVLGGRRILFADRPGLVSVVHQELQLFPTLTVIENLLMGARGSRFFRPRATHDVRAVAEEFDLLQVADRPLESCSLVVQQLTEIARAILQRKRVVLLDEPNSALTSAESDRLFTEVLRLKRQGQTIVLLVSHRLADVERYCDRVYVVREGVAQTELRYPVSASKIAQAIIGPVPSVSAASVEGSPEPVTDSRTRRARQAAGSRPPANVDSPAQASARDAALVETAGGRPDVVRVRSWSDHVEAAFTNVELTVAEGESLFITGLEDSGGREILRSIAGLRAATGTAEMLPRPTEGSLSYVPGSRANSLFPNLSVRANLCVRLGSRRLAGRSGLLRTGVMNDTAADFIDRLEIRTSSMRSPIGSLSGGTQQKVALGAALAGHPRLLVIEDPTRGVDVRTRAQIVELLRDFLAQGNAILGFSSELDEVFELADVVRVARNGQLSEPKRLTKQDSLETLAAWVDFMTRNGATPALGTDTAVADTSETSDDGPTIPPFTPSSGRRT